MSQGGSSVAITLSESEDSSGVSTVDVPTPKEELELKLQDAREQLNRLRRQQDDLERQRGELEELRRKQDEYTRGKMEMLESLTRGLATIEREQVLAQRATELCRETSTAFRDYLEQLNSLNDAAWTKENLRSELAKALSVIDNSRLEYNRAQSRLDCFAPTTASESAATPQPKKAIESGELVRYACIGAVASAPLILAGTIWVILLLVFKH